MYSQKFLNFIEIWQKDFGIEKTIDDKIAIDKDGNPLPWYTYPAIEYLKQFDYSNKIVFEFGVANSSVFWAHQAQKVVSIEDNALWFEKWQKEFDAKNLDIRLRPESEGYENAIFEDDIKYDVIIIDGKRRSQCARVAIEKIADNGMIILDDSDRVNTSKEYIEAIKILRSKKLIQVDFYGFCPMNNYSKTTSLFLQRNFDFCSKFEIQPINGIGNLWGMGRNNRKRFFKI